MNLPGRVKCFFQNLSSKTIRELIAIAVILCISLVISLPAFFSDMKEYSRQMTEILEDNMMNISSPEEQGMDMELLNKAGSFISDTSVCSFIVMRHGIIVHEKYYDKNSPDSYNNVTEDIYNGT